MAKVERSIVINLPIEKVFSYMGNPVNQLEWLPGLLNIRDIMGEGIGQRCKWTCKMMGIPFKGEAICTEYIPNERVVINTTGSIHSSWTFVLKPRGNITLLNFAVEYTMPMPLLGKLGEKLVLRQNEREVDKAIHNIKEWLEYRTQFITYLPEH